MLVQVKMTLWHGKNTTRGAVMDGNDIFASYQVILFGPQCDQRRPIGNTEKIDLYQKCVISDTANSDYLDYLTSTVIVTNKSSPK